MKNLLLIIITCMFLFSCQEKRNDAAIINYVSSELIFTLNDKVAELKERVRKFGSHPNDLKLLAEYKKIAELRENYLKNQTKENLFIYADSVHNQLTKIMKGESTSNTQVQLLNAKKQTVNSNDSADFSNLFFWILKGEELLLSLLDSRMGGVVCTFNTIVPLHLSSTDFTLGDTVYATCQISENDSLKLDFGGLYVLNKTTKAKVTRSIIVIGKEIIFQIVPKERGTFEIWGEICAFNYIGYKGCLPTGAYSFLVK